jgi:DNA-directed RNA polymerase subunit beta'
MVATWRRHERGGPSHGLDVTASGHEKLRIEGVQAVQLHLVEEVQQVYRSQGVSIHDKHVELIVRQMLRKVHILEPGDTEFLPGELVDRRRFEETNAEVVENGGEPASARPILMGITKASLATDHSPVLSA